jgi:hypothetical protein
VILTLELGFHRASLLALQKHTRINVLTKLDRDSRLLQTDLKTLSLLQRSFLSFCCLLYCFYSLRHPLPLRRGLVVGAYAVEKGGSILGDQTLHDDSQGCSLRHVSQDHNASIFRITLKCWQQPKYTALHPNDSILQLRIVLQLKKIDFKASRNNQFSSNPHSIHSTKAHFNIIVQFHGFTKRLKGVSYPKLLQYFISLNLCRKPKAQTS